MRVVTTLPSATEIVYALGVEPVATSHECDYPPAAAGKPSVERARVDPEADSATIHEQVIEAERGDGVYEVDLDALAAADPDLIVAQGVCDVCAVDRVLVEEAVERLDLDCEVLTTDPHRFADVLDDVERIGAALGREERAAELVAGFRRRVERVEERVAGRPRPRVAVLDWLDPTMVAGHWVP
ncbi:MAG: ABC transporter substrate-binding protein, partial [Haloferacaceae archaeon]